MRIAGTVALRAAGGINAPRVVVARLPTVWAATGTVVARRQVSAAADTDKTDMADPARKPDLFTAVLIFLSFSLCC
jgi:hypothetical protein